MRVYVNGIKVVGSNSWLTVNTDSFELKNVVDLNLADSYLVELRTSNGLNELALDSLTIELVNPCQWTPILNTFNKELVIPRLGTPLTMSYKDITLPLDFTGLGWSGIDCGP